ncbi:hypothetical protein KR50_10760 [Jeotgalibacillus campisalis]|uniref:Uncharacterized protein n=1 Tax=Jeotgalibacillus campisalis TaxID=220754 RepID=A0A0C2RLR4_9BACL|nr:hypothetical protein KR50_10760 [Jeotgalibacillus campisalis]
MMGNKKFVRKSERIFFLAGNHTAIYDEFRSGRVAGLI